MVVLTRGKKRRLEEEDVDRISGLPDDVLGDIISLLPTRDGGRTQLLSSRWRHLWRSAPLNVDLHDHDEPLQITPAGAISRVLSAHPGPGRSFSIRYRRIADFYSTGGAAAAAAATLDGWLRSPAIDGLQELEIHYDDGLPRVGVPPPPQLPLPASVLRFSSTLCVASFEACVLPLLPDENNDDGRTLQWPLLKQLTLSNVTISETSLQALLTGCNVLESLLLHKNKGFHQVKIVSPSLRSIGVCCVWGYKDDLQQLIIEDAPRLERLLLLYGVDEMHISIISAPRLRILGELHGAKCGSVIQFGTRGRLQEQAYPYSHLHDGSKPLDFDDQDVWELFFLAKQGPAVVVGLTAVVPSVRVLALTFVKPCLVINLIKCFPQLEKLHVVISHVREKDGSYDKYQKLITGGLDIRLRNIVLAYHTYSKSHIDFAKFFVINASLLESMRLELTHENVGNDAWIRRQRRLLQIEKRASRRAQFEFVCPVGSSSLPPQKQVHDLSILDPFERIH